MLAFGMLPAFGAQQSAQITSGAASLTLPNAAPWTTIGLSANPMRWELRLHNFGTDWPYGGNAYLVNLGPVALMRGSLTNWAQADLAAGPANDDVLYNNGPTVVGCCNTMNDVLVRVQRDVVNQRYTMEICNASGGGCLSGTSQILSYGAQSWVDWTMSLHTGGDIAFLRWFSGVVPLGTPIPLSGAVGDLGDWEFEGDLLDSSGHGLNFIGGSVQYSATPTYPPACNAGAQQTFRAGYPAILNGTASYPLDGGSFLSYVWQLVSGASGLNWSSHSVASPQIRGLVFGTYVFQLTVTDGSNQSSVCTVKDGAVATDDNNIVITGNTAVDTLLGPMVRYGANPWPWFDNRHKQAADNENSIMDVYFPPWWNNVAPGTVTVATGSHTVVGAGTTFTTTFCQGPAYPTMAQTGSPTIIVWQPLGSGTGREMFTVTSCADDTHLTTDVAFNQDQVKAEPGSGLTYASDNEYAPYWGSSQASAPANYYDNVAAYYALYYRSGIDDYLIAARKLADRFWQSPPIDQGVHPWSYGFTGRSVSAMGLVLRALDGRPDMWATPTGAPAGGLHTIWNDYMAYLNGLDGSAITDTREEGYQLAMISYCAMFDIDPAYRSTCQTSLINSFQTLWTPSRFPDGSWPQLYPGSDPVTGVYLASWLSGTSVTLTNGSATVTGIGTAWNAADFPPGARIWFTNSPSSQPANNAAGDPISYVATFVDATHLTLNTPYQGQTGSHGWEMSSYNYLGWNIMPYGEGILSGAFDLAAKALATVSPATAALARSYNVSAANWIKTYGYWPDAKGLYYVVGGIDCQPPISDSNTICTSGYAADQARSLSAEALRGLNAAYANTADPSVGAFIQTLYNAMWAAPTTCPAGSTLCVPDGTYIDAMNDGEYGIATPPTLALLNYATPWKWFGMYFGYSGESSVPGILADGVQPEAGELLYVAANMADVPGAAAIRIVTTAPSGVASTTNCNASPCAVAVDRRQGDPLLSIQYVSATGAVLASSNAPLIGGQ
jgi:hypothetical protein